MKKAILIFFCALIFSLIIPAAVQAKSWDFEKWLVDINISEDGTFIVKETHTYNFSGNFHWVQRDIDMQRLRNISDVKVYDETGRVLTGEEAEIWSDGYDTSIKLNFDLTDTQKTWTFEYKVWGGLGFFETYDELYWNAVSSERDVQIKEVEVLVHLPEAVSAANMMQELYRGYYGTTDTSANYEIVDERTLRYWGTGILAYENFTVLAGWPKGIITHNGLVKVESVPDVDILVDGENIGLSTPAVLEQGLEIDPGQHTISVARFGWEIVGEQAFEVMVEQNRIEYADFELREAPWFKILKFTPIIIPILVLIYLFGQWRERPRITKTIIAQYEQPDKLTAAEVGRIVYGQVQPRVLTATLIDLAYHGYIKIIEEEEKKFWGKSTKYYLEKLKEFQGAGIKDYEEKLLTALFDSSQRVDLGKLKTSASKKQRMVSAFNKIKKQVSDKLKAQEYFREGNAAGKTVTYIVVSFILFFAGVLAFGFLSFIYLPQALIATAVLLFIGGIILPQPLSDKGLETKWWALGFKEYLQVAERFRLGACTPETFEKFLPYAIVFGVEDKWAERFADIYKQAPEWYESTGPVTAFNVAAFGKGISSVSAAVGSSFTYSGSSASGSSGFGGGGFSGGGGGGGGSSAG